ncbi:FimV/HubP family polar landmark protein [Methylophaga lonarensis]|uniref:FimV/HubP family polar landmark protein n=1 Tax=Methylophaga lonarensis TaxID=999151 RepID=UPI003D2E8B56
MKKRSFAGKSALAAFGLLGSLDVYAFGLGQIEVFSALNEPFSAEIPLTAVRDSERDTFSVELASPQEFERAGLERNFILSQLNFEIVERNGQPRIRISSNQSIREPFLNFLVMATSDDGRILREYTVLLDPPRYALSDSRAAASPETSTARSETLTERTVTATTQAPRTESRYQGSSYGPTNRQDTLWTVAQRTRPNQNISVQQMAMALFDANPGAFNNNNVNGLRAGQTLRIPSLEEIEANWSDQRARTAFSEHQRRWNNQITAPVTAQQASEPATEVADTPATATQEAETETTAESEARLSLVAASESSDDATSVSPQGDPELYTLSEQLTLAQETIEAQAQENIDFRARMDAMELQLETLRKLIAIKDADLARLQSIAEGSLADADDASAEADFSAESLADQLLDDFALANGYQRDAVSEQADDIEAAYDDAAAPDADVAEEQMISQAAETFQLDEAEVRNIVSRVSQFVNQNRLEVMLGALLLLLILWLIARRRKHGVTWNQAMHDMERTVTVAPVTSATEGDEAEASEQSFDSPETSQPLPNKSIDELVEQADMFVGYADYVQARSSLEQARLQAPDNLLVAYKLLFVLFRQHKTEEFIRLVESSEFDETSEHWDDIRGWGQQLAPYDERFNAPETQDSLNDELETEQAEPVEESTAELSDKIIDEDLASDIEEHQVEPDHIEFDLDAFKLDDETDEQAISSDEVLREDTELLDFSTDFSLDEKPDDKTSVESLSEPETLEPIPDLSLDDDSLSDDTSSVDDDELRIDIEELSVGTEEMDSPDEQAFELDQPDELVQSNDLDQIDELDINIDDLSESLPDDTEITSERPLSELTDIEDDEVDLEFNLDEFDAIDEAETKLDLAVAYIDMGDLSVARNILSEVLQEGDEQQQARAQELLNTLS